MPTQPVIIPIPTYQAPKGPLPEPRHSTYAGITLNNQQKVTNASAFESVVPTAARVNIYSKSKEVATTSTAYKVTTNNRKQTRPFLRSTHFFTVISDKADITAGEIDQVLPKVNKLGILLSDLIHYYHKDGTLGPRASISIHKSLQDQCWELKNFTNRDTIAIKVKSGNRYIILASIYYMENSANTTDFPPESLSNLNNYATKSDLPLIIASDTNSHSVIWGNKKTDLRGETLLDTLNTLDLHWANKGKKLISANSQRHDAPNQKQTGRSTTTI